MEKLEVIGMYRS